MFIQTAIDLLKKYLPTICSRNLEISKEKQTKIFDLLARVLDFLLGDTQVSEIVEGEVDIGSGFSKDENDMQMKKAENYNLRQKLMRELYTVCYMYTYIFCCTTKKYTCTKKNLT